jgi:hypothetical protein
MGAFLLAGFASGTQAMSAEWQAGFAKVVITPTEPMWLSGYGSRSRPSEGKIHDLYAKAAVLRDPAGTTVVFVSSDLIGVPATMAKVVSKAIKKQHGISRANIMLTCSHTHCGPALDDMLSHMLAMKEQDWVLVRKNQQQLNAKMIAVVNSAIRDLKPAKLWVGNGKTGFSVNRRKPIGEGPVDHDVPVLRVTSPDGKTLRGVVFGYACHNTNMSFYKWFGDYAGLAMIALEERHSDAVALFYTGCGADQNPLPRRKMELAVKYGRMLALAVDEAMAGAMKPVTGSLAVSLKHVDLTFDALPEKTEVEQQLKTGNRYVQARARLLLAEYAANGTLKATYPYPVQVWQLGNEITWVALGGEIVVDYSLRLKKELGRHRTWVTGYANDVMAYIPSERVLKEGGYEGGSSMVYYQLPSKWKAGLEDQIVDAVRKLVADTDRRQKAEGGKRKAGQ